MMDTEDLSEFSRVQAFLLQEVVRIHEEEKNNDPEIEQIFSNTLHLDKLKKSLIGNFSINGIYYLNNEECDYYFIGDIHSDAFIFRLLLGECKFFENIYQQKSFKFIFLGDYVDRGRNHFKTVENIMLLKYLFPENIYLLMGNHDIGKIEGTEVTIYLKKMEEEKDYFYYYLRDIATKNDTFSNTLIGLYQEFLNNLNVLAFPMNSRYSFIGVHGGIPRPTDEPVNQDFFEYIKNHRELTDDSLDFKNLRIRNSLLWSDPSDRGCSSVSDTKRFKFCRDHFKSFKLKIGFDVLIRGHQAIKDGVQSFYNNSLYTVFSSGSVMSNNENINTDTVYKAVTPKVLKFDYKRGLSPVVIEITLIT